MSGQFHKTFFSIMYTAIGTLPSVLTQVIVMGAKITPKKFYEIGTRSDYGLTGKDRCLDRWKFHSESKKKIASVKKHSKAAPNYLIRALIFNLTLWL